MDGYEEKSVTPEVAAGSNTCNRLDDSAEDEDFVPGSEHILHTNYNSICSIYNIYMFANPELNNDTSLIHLLLLCICYCVCYTVILQVRLQEIIVQAQYLAVSIATTSSLSVN